MELKNTDKILDWIDSQYQGTLNILEERESVIAASEGLGLLHLKNRILENRDVIDKETEEQILNRPDNQIMSKLAILQSEFAKYLYIDHMTIFSPVGTDTPAIVIQTANETNALTGAIADRKYNSIVNYEKLFREILNMKYGYINDRRYLIKWKEERDYSNVSDRTLKRTIISLWEANDEDL